MKNITWVLLILMLIFPASTIKAASWPQDAGNAGRTGSTAESPATPWSYAWSFNGPDSNGGTGGHIYDAPSEARTITGGGFVFAPAGLHGLYALQMATGRNIWNFKLASVTSTPIYVEKSNYVIVGAADGRVYKLGASTGAVLSSYATGSSINKSLMLVDNFVFAVTKLGELHKINVDTMSRVWVYSANSAADTPPAYSKLRDTIIYATSDLYIHAIANADGHVKWRVKPSVHTAGWPFTFDKGWPVVADRHGLVFLRMQLDHDAMSRYPGLKNIFPNSQAATQQWLKDNPENKNLFAINLDNGQEQFIPAVGYGSTEDFINGNSYGVMGAQPVVKVWPDGNEVAYIHFRNGQSTPPDYRWDGHMGEMVLDNTTISGLAAGQLRFINMASHHGGVGYTDIIDEQGPLTIAGSTLIHAHWGASESVEITDRSSQKGLTFNSPITINKNPTIVRALKNCDVKNVTTHFTTCNLSYVTDGGRYWSGPGYWVYWNVVDPPGWKVGSGNTAGTSYSAGFLPRYTYVSDGYMIVEGNGGDLFVLKHSGLATQNPTPIPVKSSIKGDANGDLLVDGRDYVIWLNNYATLATGSERGDFDGNGKVDGVDYVIWLTNYDH